MGKSLKEYLVKVKKLPDEEAQDLVNVALAISNNEDSPLRTHFDFLATNLKIFRKATNVYLAKRACESLQQRLDFLTIEKIIQYNHEGEISLTDKGRKYFE